MPVGLGMGATQLGCIVMSPARAAGSLPINTVAEPMPTMPGPPGTQPAGIQGVVVSVRRAAGSLPINTVASPLIRVMGTGACGCGVGTRAAGWMGAWQCGASESTWSVIRAAGLPIAGESSSAQRLLDSLRRARQRT